MKIRNKKTGEIKEISNEELGNYGLVPEAKSGIKIKPSKKGTFKAQATKMGMGVQEAASKILNAPEGKYSPEMRKKANFAKNFAKEYGGYMEDGGGIDNPGFNALPYYVQQNIIDNMAMGGYMESGGKLPTEILRARLESHMSPNETNNYLSKYGIGGYNPYLPKYKQAPTIQTPDMSSPSFFKNTSQATDQNGVPTQFPNNYSNLNMNDAGKTIGDQAAKDFKNQSEVYRNNTNANLAKKPKYYNFKSLPFHINPMTNDRDLNEAFGGLNTAIAGSTRLAMNSDKRGNKKLFGTPWQLGYSEYNNPVSIDNTAEKWYTPTARYGMHLPMAVDGINLGQNTTGVDMFSNDPIGAQQSQGYQQAPAVQNQIQVDPNQGQQMINEQPPSQDQSVGQAPVALDQSVGQPPSQDQYYNPNDNQPQQNQTKKKRKTFDEWRKTDKGYNTLSGIQTAAGLGTFGTNVAESVLNRIGTYKENRRAQNREAEYFRQAAAYKGYDDRPLDTQYDRNALSAAYGMQIKEMGGYGEPNVEVEGREHIQLPNGFSQEIQGASHANGGIALNLPEGSKVFSENLKDPQTKKSYADLAKKFETKKNYDMLNSKRADAIQKSTAEMMIKFKNNKLNDLFSMQEEDKMSGVHGLKPMIETMQNQQPMAKYGMKLPKAQSGKSMKDVYPMFKTKIQKETETKKDISLPPPTSEDWYSSIIPNVESRYPDLRRLAEEGATGDAYKGKNFASAVLQETMYDDLLDAIEGKGKYEGLPDSEKKKALGEFKRMWGEYGRVKQNSPGKYPDVLKNIDKWDVNDGTIADLKRLRGSFTDAKLERRHLLNPVPADWNKQIPAETPITPETPATKETPATPVTKTEYIYEKPEIGFDLSIPLPGNVYGRSPLNYYQIEPDYIDPRYLDVQPQLNQVARGQRAIQSNLGGRGSTDIANMLQAQANADTQRGQVYGQKYNYDRGQDAAAQQYNAGMKSQTDMFNQGTWFNQLENPIRQREAAIDTQQRTDQQNAIENMRRNQAFSRNENFINDTYRGLQNLTPEQRDAIIFGNTAFNDRSKKTKTETVSSNKYGGKIKIKYKLRRK